VLNIECFAVVYAATRQVSGLQKLTVTVQTSS